MRRLFGLYIVFFLICVLSISMFVPTALSSQPPIDANKFIEGAIAWGPRRADPVRAYDTGSGQLIFNVYENLIAWNRENYGDFIPVLSRNVPTRVDTVITVNNASAVGTDPTGSTWTTELTCVGFNDFNSLLLGFSQGDVLYIFDGTVYRSWFIQSFVFAAGTYTLTLWRSSYTFHIRTNPTIEFINETGVAIDAFEIDDAVYALQRGLVQDQPGSPQWTFYKAFFGTMNSDPWDVDNTSRMQLAHLINNVIEKSGDDLIINLGIPFPDNAFKQILSSTCGAIVSKEFSVSIGCWDGNLLNANPLDDPDWWNSSYVRRKSRSPYDTTGVYRYVGTGPYYVSVFNQAGNQVVMQRNTGWWQGWSIPGNGNTYSKGYVDTYEIDYISSWPARRDAFVAGSLDVANVPRAYMSELLNNATKEPNLSLNPYMETIKNLQPSLSSDAFHFTFTINSTSPFIGTGSFPNGIPLNFFNNTHVRKAFAYSFNHTQYMEQASYGEAIRQYTPLIAGLCPDYRTINSGYDVNFALAEAELKQAMFSGLSVWYRGFTLSLAKNEGSDFRLSDVDIIKEFFTKLSTYDGRVGPPFAVNIVSVDWATYLNRFEAQELPIFNIGWLADFADADNFIRTYMSSYGDFSYFQNYTLANGWGGTRGSNYPTLSKDELIEQAFTTSDGPNRAKMYADLESIYIADCPSVPIPSPTGRRWCQYWVKGWYFDALYPATYMPSVYKYDDCWFDVGGSTPGIQDGIVNMRDITYLILHFNAKASIPGVAPDPKWVETYGNGCVDPYGDGTCNMRDLTGAIIHFNHKNNTLTP
jgi:peptide/nickel transport system substrate-binding protein